MSQRRVAKNYLGYPRGRCQGIGHVFDPFRANEAEFPDNRMDQQPDNNKEEKLRQTSAAVNTACVGRSAVSRSACCTMCTLRTGQHAVVTKKEMWHTLISTGNDLHY